MIFFEHYKQHSTITRNPLATLDIERSCFLFFLTGTDDPDIKCPKNPSIHTKSLDLDWREDNDHQ